MAISQIGTFQFISMTPFPSGPNERLILETRAGVAGTAVWKAGTGGEPFTVTTVRDTTTFNQAQSTFRDYEAAVGGQPVGIIHGGTAAGFLVVVLSVEPIEVAGTALGVGGILNTSNGIVRARWHLLPWKV